MEKKSQQSFTVSLAIFYELIKFQNFELIKLFLNVSDIIHANEHA